MQFELYYNNGGHGGPYSNHTKACVAAQSLLWGSHTMSRVEVRPRNSRVIGGYGEHHIGSTYVSKDSEGIISYQMG